MCQKIDFPVFKGPYLGQKPPGIKPEIFAPGIVSTEKKSEAAMSFSPDLQELFFSYRSPIEGRENRILHMKMINNVWTKPELPSFVSQKNPGNIWLKKSLPNPTLTPTLHLLA